MSTVQLCTALLVQCAGMLACLYLCLAGLLLPSQFKQSACMHRPSCETASRQTEHSVPEHAQTYARAAGSIVSHVVVGTTVGSLKDVEGRVPLLRQELQVDSLCMKQQYLG